MLPRAHIRLLTVLFFIVQCSCESSILGNISSVHQRNNLQLRKSTVNSVCPLPKLIETTIEDSSFLPILFAKTASALLSHKDCGKHAQKFLDELQNGTLWAARMFDASTKIPEGVLFGHLNHYGNFDECYEISTEDMNGQHCLVQFGYSKSKKFKGADSRGSYVKPDLNSCVSKFLTDSGTIMAVRNFTVQVGLCVPSSCSPADIEFTLKESLKKVQLLHPLPQEVDSQFHPLSVSVNPLHCQTRNQEPELSTAGYIFCGLALGLFILVTISTWYHSKISLDEKKDANFVRDLLLCFSMQKNVSNLVQRSRPNDPLSILDGFRVILMFGVVFAHRALQFMFTPSVNAEHATWFSRSSLSLSVVNSSAVIDMFFCMSCILFTKSWVQHWETGKSLKPINVFFKRYVRLTPSYAFVIWFYSSILPHIGSGPQWPSYMEYESVSCQKHWWRNILYINNYGTNSDYCMMQSWYLSIDFQSHCITFFLIYFCLKLSRWRRYQLLTFLIVATSVICASITYINQAMPTFELLPFYIFKDIRENPYYNTYYNKIYMRLNGYLVGIPIGLLTLHFIRTNHRLSKFWSRLFFFIGFIITIPSIHAWLVRYNFVDVSELEMAFYGGFHRVIYSLGFSAGFISVAFGSGLGSVRKFLASHNMHVLSKLTYGMFLTHNLNQIFDHNTARFGTTISSYKLFSNWILDTCIAMMISFVLWIIIESPIQNIQSLFNQKRTSVSRKTD